MGLTRILKGSRVAEIDRKCIESGISSKWLMNNAGSSVARIIIGHFKSKKRPSNIKGVVVCGKGNNGGDGFVAATRLINSGMDITVFYTSPAEKMSPDSQFYFKKLEDASPESLVYLEPDNGIENLLSKKIKEADFLIDAIFGTGLHGKDIYGSYKKIIEKINEYKKYNKKLITYSADIPSGIDSDNGKVLGVSIKADYTITFGCKKFGMVNYPGAYYSGKIEVADIGIPKELFGEYEKIYEPDFEWVADKIPYREPWTYKHRVGKLLVVAGSIGFTGAATMVCKAAMRAGAGLVTLICPWELNSIFEEKLTEVMTYPVEETEDITIHSDSKGEIARLSKGYDALVIGPGLSRNSNTISLVRELLKDIEKPIVLDADGLRALCGPREIGKNKDFDLSNVIITPHSGELAAILGKSKINLEERLEVNLEVVRKFGVVSVLKGARTLVTGNDETTFVNPTGDWALATAGTGDILSGIIGSFLSQGMDLIEGAVCGSYVHGLSSDIVTKETSKTSLIATDLLEGIKKVFLEIEEIKYKK